MMAVQKKIKEKKFVEKLWFKESFFCFTARGYLISLQCPSVSVVVPGQLVFFLTSISPKTLYCIILQDTPTEAKLLCSDGVRSQALQSTHRQGSLNED